MKIVQVQTQATAAGAQRISDLVGAGLNARGHKVRTVFMYRKTEAYDGDPNADIVLARNPQGALDQLRAVWGLLRYLRRERPDVVITYQHWGNLFGALGARLAGVKTVIANQSGAPFRKGPLRVVSLLDKLIGSLGVYTYNVVNSRWTTAQFDTYPKAYRDRLRLIVHGVSQPAPSLSRQDARKHYGLPGNVPLIVSSGSLSKAKNQHALVGALDGLPDAHLAIAGTGPAHDELIALAESHGCRDRLHLVGEVPRERIYDFLAAGDVFAFASLNETFGLSVVEAAVAGLPVVATDLDVLREVLTHPDGEPAAMFASTPDAKGFAKALAQIQGDAAEAGQLVAAGRRLARVYAPETMVDGYARLLPN